MPSRSWTRNAISPRPRMGVVISFLRLWDDFRVGSGPHASTSDLRCGEANHVSGPPLQGSLDLGNHEVNETASNYRVAISKPTRSFYDADVREFVDTSIDEIVGLVLRAFTQDLVRDQNAAWRRSIAILQAQLRPFSDLHVFLEFLIPRMGFR